jgi:hypothetical protein
LVFLKNVLVAGAGTILLDNFTTAQLSLAVARIAGRALVEASGGITLARIREVAETGVDIISMGALTHSVRLRIVRSIPGRAAAPLLPPAPAACSTTCNTKVSAKC